MRNILPLLSSPISSRILDLDLYFTGGLAPLKNFPHPLVFFEVPEWDLPCQLDLIVNVITGIFPAATKVKLTQWIEWEYNHSTGRWKPFVRYTNYPREPGAASVEEREYYFGLGIAREKGWPPARDYEGTLEAAFGPSFCKK